MERKTCFDKILADPTANENLTFPKKFMGRF